MSGEAREGGAVRPKGARGSRRLMEVADGTERRATGRRETLGLAHPGDRVPSRWRWGFMRGRYSPNRGHGREGGGGRPEGALGFTPPGREVADGIRRHQRAAWDFCVAPIWVPLLAWT
jgi:hypothetical protein